MFIALCLILKNIIHGKKEQFKNRFRTAVGIKKIFGIANSLLGRRKQALLPQHNDYLTLARLFNELIEKVFAIRLVEHMTQNAIMDKFHSAYKAHHSTETALLRVYKDVMFNIDRGNDTLLVLLDLSAEFDTIDHQFPPPPTF